MGSYSRCRSDSLRLQNTDSYNFRFLPLVSIFLLFCMSQKAELPSLTGHRTKTRKRDEKQVNNPTGFRDSVIEGLSKTGQEGSDITEIEVGVDLDAVFKFLDTAGNKLDYRRYGEVLLEILIAGGLLAPGGSYQNEGGDKPATTRACVFQVPSTSTAPRPGTSRSSSSSCVGTSTSRRCWSRR